MRASWWRQPKVDACAHPWLQTAFHCNHTVFREELCRGRGDAASVARLPLSSSGWGNEAYGPTSTTPSKTDVHKQTKWQQTGGGREGDGRRGGGGEMFYSSGMFSCSHAPPLCSVWADITHETVMTIKRPTTPWLVPLHPVIFFFYYYFFNCRQDSLYKDRWKQLLIWSLKLWWIIYVALLGLL